jgi:hypothetical protein
MNRAAVFVAVLLLGTTLRAAVTAMKSVVLDSTGVVVAYQIDVANSGASAVQAFVVDNVPATIVNVSAAIVSGGGAVSVDHGTNAVWWTGISIPANGTATLRLDGTVRSGATAGLVVSNQATVQYDSDGNGTEDTATATNVASFVVPSREIHATIQKTQLTPSPVAAGTGAGNLVYRITVTASPLNERSAYFTIAETPAAATSVTLDSATTASGTWNATTHEWSTDWILPGQSATLDVTITVNHGAPAQVSNTASMTFGAFDFVPGAASTVLTDIDDTLPCTAPVITTPPPASVTILPGASQFLSVVATGTSLTYRWTYVFPISGTEAIEATTQSVTVTPPYSRQYRITVANECGQDSATSNVCVIPRVSAPSVDSNPGGATTTLHVSIDPLLSFRDWPTLQWYRGSSGDTTHPISGATTAVIDVSASDAASYWVRATNGCTSYDSAATAVASAATPAIPTLSHTVLVMLMVALASLAIRKAGTVAP